MFLEKITPQVFGMFAIGVFAIILFLFRDRRSGTSKSKLKGWQVFLLGFSTILAIVLFAVVRYLIAFKPRFDVFSTHMSEYTSVTTQQPGEWYLRGKILPIDTSDNTVDVRIYYELPDDMRPITPEEVTMALWMDCTERTVGTYTHGGGAIQWYCDVTLVDMTVPAIIGESSFTGSEPPGTNPGSSDQTGSFPSKEIINYLGSLPIK